MTSWPGQPPAPPRPKEKNQLVYMTEDEFQEKIFAVCAALDGVVMSQALAVLRDCELWITSTARVGSTFAVEASAQSPVASCGFPGRSRR